MPSRHSRLASPLFLLPLLVASTAVAQPKDQDATKLADDAIMVDYLGMNFDAAVEKLKKAIQLCGADKCTKPLIARLHRDLGTIYVVGQNKPDEGRAEFQAALAADPNVVLDPDLANDQVQQIFNEVKGAGGTPPGAGPAAPTEPVPGGPPGAGVPTSGDVLHTPPAEQVVLTPVPIYVELAKGLAATAVQVRFQPPNGGDWQTVVLAPIATGYGGEIPCKGVGSVQGTLKYFIQVMEGGDLVAASGSRTAPLTVAIKDKLTGAPPTLPGKPPPQQCIEECPPGFPGCGPAEAGGECQVEDDCQKGLSCVDNICTKVKAKDTRRKHWLSAGLQLDMMMFGAEKDVCDGGNSYQCFFRDGSYYWGVPDDTEPGGPDAGNSIASGGFGLSTLRVMVGYDYHLKMGLAFGGRLGFAFRGGPQAPNDESFMPIHAEVRGAYYLKGGPIKPYVLLAGGFAEFKGRVVVDVRHSDPPDLRVDSNGDGAWDRNDDINNDGRVDPAELDIFQLNAWRTAGQAFAQLGGGVMLPIGENMGPFVEVKGGMAFPTSAVLFNAQLGFAIGF